MLMVVVLCGDGLTPSGQLLVIDGKKLQLINYIYITFSSIQRIPLVCRARKREAPHWLRGRIKIVGAPTNFSTAVTMLSGPRTALAPVGSVTLCH